MAGLEHRRQTCGPGRQSPTGWAGQWLQNPHAGHSGRDGHLGGIETEGEWCAVVDSRRNRALRGPGIRYLGLGRDRSAERLGTAISGCSRPHPTIGIAPACLPQRRVPVLPCSYYLSPWTRCHTPIVPRALPAICLCRGPRETCWALAANCPDATAMFSATAGRRAPRRAAPWRPTRPPTKQAPSRFSRPR